MQKEEILAAEFGMRTVIFRVCLFLVFFGLVWFGFPPEKKKKKMESLETVVESGL